VDKLERLLNLTAALLHTSRPLTAEEIRERVPGYPDGLSAFRRTFERDKDDLREMGVPLSIERIEGEERPVDGYRIHERDYYLRDPGLDPDESAALNLALSAVRLDGVQGVEALWKLGGAVNDDDGSTELASLPSDPTLVPVFGAIVDRRTATFVYRGSERTAERTVEPHRLDFRRGRWYLTGLDRLTDDERVFRLDRIDGALALGEPDAFQPPEGLAEGPAEPWEFGDDDPVTARMLVDRDHVVWAEQALGRDAAVAEYDDGAVVFEVAVSNWPAFRSFVAAFLEHAELLEPSDLRADLVAWLEAIRDTPPNVASDAAGEPS
jgi:proteasome accessory factor B